MAGKSTGKSRKAQVKKKAAGLKKKSAAPRVNTAVKNKELVIERLFNASRERVWAAWTVPGFFSRWWGPRGFTTPVCSMEVKAGGRYLSCMRSADNKDIWSTGVYKEVVPLEKLVMTDSFADDQGDMVPATYYGLSMDFPMQVEIKVEFKDLGGKTKLLLRHPGIPAAFQKSTGNGWLESFDKLDEILARVKFTPVKGKSVILVSALLDAPRERVFNALTDPALIPKWWGPRNLDTKVDKLDLRPEGLWRFVQTDKEGNEYAFNGKYLEITPPERLSYTFEFEGMPGRILTETVTLAAENGKTTARETVVYASLEDRDGMLKAGMESGSVESMDRLAELLESMKAGGI